MLDPLLDTSEPFAPTHSALVAKHRGSCPAPLKYETWLENTTVAWNSYALAGPNEEALDAYLTRMGGLVDDTSADFIATMEAAATLPRSTLSVADEFAIGVQVLGAMWSDVRFGSPPCEARERLDAYIRALALHGARAGAPGHTGGIDPNHATDLHLLHHLADGAIVLTTDTRLIQLVMDSESVQAPWLRTPSEVLLGKLPKGPPFGWNARRQRDLESRRTKASLEALKREAERLFPSKQASR